MAADRKLEHLARVGMFSSLNKKELALVARASDVVSVAPGSELVKEGDFGHEFYLILDGTATVRRGGRKIAELAEGDYFGELALLDRGPRSASVATEGPAEMLVIGQREFLAVLDQVPAVSRKLLASMAARLREADRKAVSH